MTENLEMMSLRYDDTLERIEMFMLFTTINFMTLEILCSLKVGISKKTKFSRKRFACCKITDTFDASVNDFCIPCSFI